MPLLQPSFRGRLRLFFAVIVIVPMIAIGVVLFRLLDLGGTYKLDSGLDQAQKTAKAIYEQDRDQARDALVSFTKSRELATAIDDQQGPKVQEQLDELATADPPAIDRPWWETDAGPLTERLHRKG